MAKNKKIDPNTTTPLDPEHQKKIAYAMGGQSPLSGACEAMDGSDGQAFIYQRYSNPSVLDAESALVEVEGGKCSYAVLTSSGMAAIHTALTIFEGDPRLTERPWLFAGELYGGTHGLTDRLLVAKRKLPIKYFPAPGLRIDSDAFADEIQRIRPALVLVEAVTNPTLQVLDIRKIGQACRDVGATFIVDNTFATPWLLKPLEHGADLVIHSATKFLTGHGTITAGVILGCEHVEPERNVLPEGCPGFLDQEGQTSRPRIECELRQCRKMTGAVLSPWEAYNLNMQLESFRLRIREQMRNAAQLASFLSDHPKVKQVSYPGLAEGSNAHPNHKIAADLFQGRGFGAMISFEMHSEAHSHKLCEILHPEVTYRTTLGDLHTTILHVKDVFGAARFSEHPAMLRLSVGTEPYSDLEGIFAAKLAAV